MSLRMKHACLGASFLVLIAATNAVMAVECDQVNSLHNLEGTLTLANYTTDISGQGSTLLKGKVVNGECQVSSVTMYTKTSALTSDVGDGRIVRMIDMASGNYSARLSITAPEISASASARSLVFQEMTFSPAWDGGQGLGKLVFSLNTIGGSTTGTASWYLNASIHYNQYPSGAQDRLLGQSFRAFNANGTWTSPTQGFEIELVYAPSPNPMYPRLQMKVRPFLGAWATRYIDLPSGMWPVDRSQGLIQQTNIPSQKTFTISNLGSVL